jgi:hypothetical protein
MGRYIFCQSNEIKPEYLRLFQNAGRSLLHSGDIESGYKFLVEALENTTCDCMLYSSEEYDFDKWRNSYFGRNNPSIVCFCIAYVTYYYHRNFEKESRFDRIKWALENIDIYLQSSSTSFGYFLKGRILYTLGEYDFALQSYLESQKFGYSPRTAYRIARLRKEVFKENVLKDLYYTYLVNPDSSCCLRELGGEIKDVQAFLPLIEGYVDNPLIGLLSNPPERQIDFELYFQKHKDYHLSDFVDYLKEVKEYLLDSSKSDKDGTGRIVSNIDEDIEDTLSRMDAAIQKVMCNDAFSIAMLIQEVESCKRVVKRYFDFAENAKRQMEEERSQHFHEIVRALDYVGRMGYEYFSHADFDGWKTRNRRKVEDNWRTVVFSSDSIVEQLFSKYRK